MATSQRRTTLDTRHGSVFRAVEERMRRELRGRPVVAGADPKGGKGRSVVRTCNYEAREYGLRSGIPHH